MEPSIALTTRLIKPEDAAVMLGINLQTLAVWRCKRRGPMYVKIGGRAVRYPLEQLQAWIDRRTVSPVEN